MAVRASAMNVAQIAAWWLALGAAGVLAQSIPEGKPSNCPKPPIAPCTIGHGRFSTQNGITQVIWLVGTTRRLDVANEAHNFFPPGVLKYLEMTSPDHSYIFGDFTICPIERDTPGRMRAVCVADAKNLVVQNTMDLSRVFRVQSTWAHRGK